MRSILVRGANEVGSAVALQLFNAGFPVSLHEAARPDTNRRSVSFSDCAFDGEASFGGVRAVLVDELNAVRPMLTEHSVIPMTIHPIEAVVLRLQPDILIDARMRKHAHPESQIGLAPLTMGLGPNFVAAANVDLIVETGWGDDLGRVSDQGATRPLEGDPHPIDGHSRDRFVYAPSAGLFRTECSIGQLVIDADVIGDVDGVPIFAPLSGMLKGLTHDGAPINRGTKIVEVDPRGAEAGVPTSVSTRPARIARGILAAIERLESRQQVVDPL
jgi:xanthine dehydrogenase accessory factor